jgi:hypothetical protein
LRNGRDFRSISATARALPLEDDETLKGIRFKTTVIAT